MVWHLEWRCSNPECEADACPAKRPPFNPPEPTLSERLSALLGTTNWQIIGYDKPLGHGRLDGYKLDDLEELDAQADM